VRQAAHEVAGIEFSGRPLNACLALLARIWRPLRRSAL